MLSDFVLDYLVLSDTYSIVELLAAGPIIGQTLIDLNIPQRFGINIAAIKRRFITTSSFHKRTQKLKKAMSY